LKVAESIFNGVGGGWKNSQAPERQAKTNRA